MVFVILNHFAVVSILLTLMSYAAAAVLVAVFQRDEALANRWMPAGLWRLFFVLLAAFHVLQGVWLWRGIR